ncbi:hypothetical protein [Spirosoma telluris]|uniref:hypothetical protein n=1 Tax=Spirosoma telluris TaxID=2183553 RepID=UPI002FC2DC7C
MSTRPPNNSSGPLDHLSMRYLRQVLDMSHPVDEPYVLNSVESRVIRRTKVITITIATLLGITGFYYCIGHNTAGLNFSARPLFIC